MAAYTKEDNPANNLPKELKTYIDLRIDIISLHLLRKLYQNVSVFALSAIISFAILFFLFFGSYSFIMWYADYYGNASTAAFIVAGFYLLIALLVFAFRKQLIYRPLKKSLYRRVDFREFHKDTTIAPIHSDADFEKEMLKVEEKIEENSRELEYLADDIKDYYSFDAIKERFVNDLFENPKPILGGLMQGIMAFKELKGRHFSRKRKR